MTRLENSVGLRELIRLFYAFVDNFLDSYETAPKCIIIDMDPTPNRVYGDQQMALFGVGDDGAVVADSPDHPGAAGPLACQSFNEGKLTADIFYVHNVSFFVSRGPAPIFIYYS